MSSISEASDTAGAGAGAAGSGAGAIASTSGLRRDGFRFGGNGGFRLRGRQIAEVAENRIVLRVERLGIGQRIGRVVEDDVFRDVEARALVVPRGGGFVERVERSAVNAVKPVLADVEHGLLGLLADRERRDHGDGGEGGEAENLL